MMRIGDDQLNQLRRQRLERELGELMRAGGRRADVDPVSADLVVTDPKDRATRFAFDSRGYLSSVTTPGGRRWQIENTPDGCVRRFTTPGGVCLSIDYGSDGKATRVARNSRTALEFAYANDEAPVRVTYPDRTSTSVEYYGPGRPARIIDRLGAEVRYEYNAHSGLASIQDPAGNRTAFEYGAHARPYFVRFPDGTSESYEYDDSGQLTALQAGSEPVVRITRDSGGRPTEMRFGDGDRSEFSYDARGNVVEARNLQSTVSYSYDAGDRVRQEAQDGKVVSYEYDACGALTALTYPSGGRAEFEYDPDGRPLSAKDWNGGLFRVHYQPADSGLLWECPNGVSTSISYTDVGLPAAIETRGASQICSLHYQYDEEDRISTLDDSDYGYKAYRYDAEGQLVSVSAEQTRGSETFAYDQSGNRMQWNHKQCAVSGVNALLTQGSMRCSYDERGNLISRISRNRERRFFYNSQNLLVRAEDSYGCRVEFGYDAFRRRVWKKSEKEEVRYLWAGEQMIAEISRPLDGGDPKTCEYLYQPGTPAPLAMRTEDRVYCYHNDHLGTPRRMTDEKGLVVWSATYAGYGQAIITTEKVANPLRFPGQYFDQETGFHYNRFRYYCPGLGRYLSRDPLTFLAGLNFYKYAGNDPINSADSSGLRNWKAVVEAAAPALAAVAVGAAIIAFAPVSLPVAALLAGAAAGAVLPALTDAIKAWDGKKVCLKCTLERVVAGALGGALAAGVSLIPGGGFAAVAFKGAVSGSVDYTVTSLADGTFNWKGLEGAALVGAATGGISEALELEPTKLGRPLEEWHWTDAERAFRLASGAAYGGEGLVEAGLDGATGN